MVLQTGISGAAMTEQRALDKVRIRSSLEGIFPPLDKCVIDYVLDCLRTAPTNSDPLFKLYGEITINKDEILRDLEEIRKKAEEVGKALEGIKVPLCPMPLYPPWPAYPYFTWETPNITIATATASGAGETTTNADAPTTPTGD